MYASKWKSYPNYKESIERNFMQIPSHWKMIPNRHLMKLRNQKVGKDWSSTDLLSLTLQGVIPRDIDSGVGKYPASFESYQIVEIDDLVFCLFDIAETPRTIGISKQRGMITGAYDVLTCVDGVSPHFVHDYYLALDFIKGLEPYYTGLRKVTRTDNFNQMKTPIPPLNEQLEITNFIQRFDTKVSSLQRLLRENVALLKEKRSALINQIVVTGLDQYVETKDSTINWLGKIPVHWDIRKVKHISIIENSGSFGLEPGESEFDMPVCTTAHISTSGKFDLEKMHLRSFSAREKEEYMGRPGDIFIVKSSGSNTNIISGKLGQIKHDTPEIIFSNFLMRIRPIHSHAHPPYLAYFLSSELTKQRVKRMVATTTYPNIDVSEYTGSAMPIPPMEEQKAITQFLDRETMEIDLAVQLLESKIDFLREYRTGIFSAAVTGQIDVRGM